MPKRKNSNSPIVFTDRSNASFDLYLKDVSKRPLLSPEESHTLLATMKAGGPQAEAARKRFIEANLRYVITVAKQCDRGVVPISELIQEGSLGLIKAVDTFDESLGYTFTTYADPIIRHQIEYVQVEQNAATKAPVGQLQAIREFNQLDQKCRQDNLRPLTLDEFCEATGNKPDTMAKAMATTQGHTSLDTVIRHDDDDDGGCTLGDLQKAHERSDDTLIRESNSIEIQDFLRNELTDREIFVINSLYGLSGDTYFLDDIADRLGVSVDRVRQIEKSALNKLKSSPHADCLRVLLAA